MWTKIYFDSSTTSSCPVSLVFVICLHKLADLNVALIAFLEELRRRKRGREEGMAYNFMRIL